MAQVIIHANGETTGSSFHLVSRWNRSGNSYLYGPTVASATYTYSLAMLPAGSTVTKVTVMARVGVRFTPNGGVARGYPKANDAQLTEVAGSTDPFLYSAVISFKDTSSTTKVTYSFRAAGYGQDGEHSGSLSFDDVYLLVDYIPPCSDWSLSATSEYTGNSIWADIVMTDSN